MERKSWTPAELLQLSGGYWSACALHAGVALDLFTLLAAEPRNVEELAGLANADARGLAMLLNALTAMGFLEKRGEEYGAALSAAEYLSSSSPNYLGHIISHHYHLMAGWSRLAEAVRKGAPVRERSSHVFGEKERESFEMGMFDLAMLLAPRIVLRIDLSCRRRLLDLGGGPGTYAIQFCLQNPGLEAVVCDLPTTRPFAEATIARFGLADRVVFQEGDFITQEIAGRYDVAWLSHILHGEGREGCAVVLERAMAALEPGGLILVQEFILDDDRTGPLYPALFSLNMLIGTPAGQAYTGAELSEMLVAAGAVGVHRLSLELPNGAGIIAGTVPG